MALESGSPLQAQHIWKFIRAGALDQVRLESGQDLLALDKLDQKLWVALSCPTLGLEFDAQTLALMDTDQDGRLRVPEVLAALRWTLSLLKQPGDLMQGAEALPLAAIDEQREAGARVLATARHILASLGKPEATEITVADAIQSVRILAQTRFNGDGVVPPESAPDAETKQLCAEVLATVGGKVDRSGAPGITQPLVAQFFLELQNYADWWKAALQPAQAAPTILVLGEATASAYAALEAVRNKVADYYARCRLAAFDPRAAGPLNRAETEFAALALQDLAHYGQEVASLPLARVEAGRPLPLVEGLNPAWSQAMDCFRRAVVEPLLGAGRTSLTDEEWAALIARFQPYQDWQAAKPGAVVEKLGLARIRQILAGPGREVLAGLIDQDLALAPRMAEIAAVDRLARYYRDLFKLLNNFVTFKDFYSPDRKAIFQAGTLYLDGRSCELCLKVQDVERHAAMAALGRIYLVYCELRRAEAAGNTTIAAAFTSGAGERLVVGRNGIFYDRQGRDWDATVVKVVEHPISLQEAVWSPFKRLGRFVGEQFEKIATAREQAVRGAVIQEAQRLDQGAATAPAVAAKPTDTSTAATSSGLGALIGLLAGGGVALAALGSAAAHIAKTLSTMSALSIAITALCLFLIISGPSVLVAWFKLRARDLGPVLEASGWAINGRIKLTMRLGQALTPLARLPLNSIRSLDQLAPEVHPRVRPWLWVLVALAITAALFRLWRIW